MATMRASTRPASAALDLGQVFEAEAIAPSGVEDLARDRISTRQSPTIEQAGRLRGGQRCAQTARVSRSGHPFGYALAKATRRPASRPRRRMLCSSTSGRSATGVQGPAAARTARPRSRP